MKSEILMPARIVDRHVGGNTTYARNIASGLSERGYSVGRIPARSNPLLTMLQESLSGLGPDKGNQVLHYVADTGPLLRTRRPSVITVHGVASRWIDSARTRSQEKIWRERVARGIRSTREVITVSNSSARDIVDVFDVDPARLTTIPHGLELGRFAEEAKMSDEIRRKLPNSFALYLGNIEPRKNLIALVRAFERREIRSLGVPLVIAGKAAWNAEESQRVIAESSNTIQLGFVSNDDRAALMRECALFVFPSLYEGFGFPVLEALAAGAVVVTSNRGSLEEVAGPALRFESVDETGIVDGVTQALQDTSSRENCRSHGRAWAQRYSWEVSVDKHVEVYERVRANG